MSDENGSDSDVRTKYRPDKFEDVIGQSATVKALQKSLKDKSSHAYLLHGPPGTGKTTLARLIAKAVGCKGRSNYNEVNAANLSGIDAMRQLVDDTVFKGLGGGTKVVVLDEAQRLSAPAWSVLLKPMEEPPAHVYWLICTTDPGKIPKANLTRCVQLETKPVSADLIAEWLAGVCEAEGYATSEDVIYLLAQKCDGSPRQALVNLIKCHECKTRKQASRMLKEIHVEGEGAVGDLCRLLCKGADWQQAMVMVKDIAAKDPNAESVRQVVLQWFYKMATDAKGGDRAEQAVAVLDAFATPYPPSNNLYPVVLSLAQLLL